MKLFHFHLHSSHFAHTFPRSRLRDVISSIVILCFIVAISFATLNFLSLTFFLFFQTEYCKNCEIFVSLAREKNKEWREGAILSCILAFCSESFCQSFRSIYPRARIATLTKRKPVTSEVLHTSRDVLFLRDIATSLRKIGVPAMHRVVSAPKNLFVCTYSSIVLNIRALI